MIQSPLWFIGASEVTDQALSSHIGFKDVIGRRALIYGDVGTGKTRLTVRLLDEAVAIGWADRITIIDMAPKGTTTGNTKVGGRLPEAAPSTVAGLRYLAPRSVETPRLAASNGKELLSLVEKNRRRIERLLSRFTEAPTMALFLNDISIFLQSGDFDTLWATMRQAPTVVANGYYGKTLSHDFSTGISDLERRLMERLLTLVDVRIKL